MARSAKDRTILVDRLEAAAAVEFCAALARTLGPLFRVSLYQQDPPLLVESWGAPRRWRDEDPIPALLSTSDGNAVNHPVGRRGRVSVLPFPSPGPGQGLAVAVEADTAALSSAAGVLSSLADPDGTEGEPDSPAHVGDTLERLMAAAEERIGMPSSEMSRSQKQEVVKFLDDRGAFLLRKAVEQVAGRLGVSRFTIYNYLDEVKQGEEG